MSRKPRYYDLPTSRLVNKENTPQEIARVVQIVHINNSPSDAAEILEAFGLLNPKGQK